MASGDSLASWGAFASFGPSTNFARNAVSAVTLVPNVKFDDATDETRYFSGVVPGQYDGSSALTTKLMWKFESFGTSQTCDWEVSFGRLDDDGANIDTVVFATAQTGLGTEPGTDGEIDYYSVTFTNAQADGIQPGEAFILRVTRDASGGTQGSPGDAELYFVHVAES